MQKADLPGLLVYANNEAAEVHSMGSDPPLKTTAQLLVIGVVRADDPEDLADTIVKKVQVAISADQTMGGLARETLYAGLEMLDDKEGDQVYLAAQMTFNVVYSVQLSDPTVAF